MQLTASGHSRSERAVAPRQTSRTFALFCLAVAMALVFFVDRLTGVPHVQHLYYFPIIFAAIRFGTMGSSVTAALAILLYHLANPLVLNWRYEESDVFQIVVFIAVGLVAARLADDARRLHGLAMTDDLTGLHNLRSFELELHGMVQSAVVERTPLSLLVIDVDRLKSLNDEHGHLAGAEAVRTVGGIIAHTVPPEAVACRYGGDEFVIAIPRCAGPTSTHVADDLRRAVRACVPTLAGLQFPERTLSISTGVAWCNFDKAENDMGSPANVDAESEALFRAADRALYVAKNGGRDRVHVIDCPVGSLGCG